jgi:hypothetical protein
MSGLIQNCDDCNGTIEINEVPGSDPFGRWCIYDLAPLLTDEADRGTDLLMPTAQGRRPKPRRFDVTRYLLPIVFTGWVDDAGDPLGRGDAPAQLVATIDAFQTALGIGPARGPALSIDGTVPAVWDKPNGAQWTTDLHVLRLRNRQTAWGIWDGDLELSLPMTWTVGS